MDSPILIALPAETVAWLRQLADDTRVNCNRLADGYAASFRSDDFAAFCAQRDHANHAARVIAAIDSAEGRQNALADALARIAQHGGAAHA